MKRSFVLLCLGVPTAAVAHTIAAGGTGNQTSDWLGAGIPILCAAVLYVLGWVALKARGSSWRAVAFVSGLLTLTLALLSPLDTAGAEFFWVHMVQHETLMLICAPLLVLGRPLAIFIWAFPRAVRAVIARAVQQPAVKRTWRTLSSPGTAWLLHALALWIWHVPALFNAVATNRFIHDLQHVSFVATALLFWSALFEERRAAQQGAGIVYLFTTTIHSSVLGALITFASRPWYSAYGLEDQQLGGLIMWVPGSLVYVGIALVLLARWIAGSHRQPAT